ncbi:hypothetical protein Tco_0459602 [Tanacetum coccineum]
MLNHVLSVGYCSYMNLIPKLKIEKVQNVVADHLSQIENDETSDDSEVDDNFPREALMEINTRDEPWFAYFANYLFWHSDYIASYLLQFAQCDMYERRWLYHSKRVSDRLCHTSMEA